MKHSSADLLEFEALCGLINRYVGSALGQACLRAAQPTTDRVQLEQLQALNAEAIAYLRAAKIPQPAARGSTLRLRFSEVPDCQSAAEKLRIEGSVLEGKEVFDLLAALGHAADARAVLTALADRFPLLAAKASAIGDLRPLLKELAGKVLADGSLADDASPALNRIRRSVEKQKRLIQESLERFLRAHQGDGVLQEEFITLRNDRFVVPIVAGRQGRVQGVIHSSSGSGHTLFVEPLETIELNNELVRMIEEEAREAHRILRLMTEKLREQDACVRASLAVLGELDYLFAKAAFAEEFGARPARFSPAEAPRLHLVGARHPLLEDVLRRQGKSVVPLALTLEGDRRTLLLSGPNMGGKTVALKTVGLLALMAQAGMPVPAEEAEFPVFESILADVGDKQSIAESLSTFSAHMQRIREILELVTPDSLVLLDELGRATDPEEGGALGVAIVDCLRSWKAFTLVSTHLLALKVYAAKQEGVLNASMGFDWDSLAPTYQLRLGMAGESAALAIAGRLGLSGYLLERARAAMASYERDLSDVLARLEQRAKELESEKQLLEQERQQLEARRKDLAREWAARESAKLEELERRAQAVIRQFEERSENWIDSMAQAAQQRKAAERARREAAKTVREFREQFEASVLAGGQQPQPSPAPSLKIQPGDRVRLKQTRQPALVTRLLGEDRLEVQAGVLKLQVNVDEVAEVLPPSGAPSAARQQTPSGPRWDDSCREINVIGKHAEEALEEVDRFLDQAVMASVSRVRIVHGHGMGVLKKAIAQMLATHPHVASFHPAPQNEGGSGATIATLK